MYPDLSKYKSGIYHYTGLPPADTRMSDDDPLEPVNHALVAVGYGVDPKACMRAVLGVHNQCKKNVV